MTGPAFSVVVPLYNRRAYVLRALGGAMEQEHPPGEIIVVDDGSTDDGPDLVRHEFEHVKVIRQDNAGVGAARNAGIREARSSWIALLDADDLWMPNHLRELARIITAVPDASLVSTRHRSVAQQQTLPRIPDARGRVRRVDYFEAAARDSRVVWTSSAAVRREVLTELGGFGPWPIGEDIELWARIALERPVAVSDAVTALYVRGTGGVMERDVARSSEGHGQVRVPDRVADLSHSCATVVQALDREDLPVRRESLIGYLDARVVGKINSSLLRGDVCRAKALRQLLHRRFRPRWLVSVGLTYLPAPVLRVLLAAARLIRG